MIAKISAYKAKIEVYLVIYQLSALAENPSILKVKDSHQRIFQHFFLLMSFPLIRHKATPLSMLTKMSRLTQKNGWKMSREQIQGDLKRGKLSTTKSHLHFPCLGCSTAASHFLQKRKIKLIVIEASRKQ